MPAHCIYMVLELTLYSPMLSYFIHFKIIIIIFYLYLTRQVSLRDRSPVNGTVVNHAAPCLTIADLRETTNVGT
jgi:uncharacterized membrane protein